MKGQIRFLRVASNVFKGFSITWIIIYLFLFSLYVTGIFSPFVSVVNRPSLPTVIGQAVLLGVPFIGMAFTLWAFAVAFSLLANMAEEGMVVKADVRELRRRIPPVRTERQTQFANDQDSELGL